MSKKKTFIIAGLILLAAAALVVVVFLTEPTAQRESATRETAMLVDVITVERGNYRPVIMTTGTVEPVREISLSPRVSGEIVRRAGVFDPGQSVRAGTLLLKVDDADYQNTYALRKGDLEEARANLTIEKGRQDVARRDFEQSQLTLSDERKALVLREPQLKTAEAAVMAAESALDQAALDLQRTSVVAPFDALILERNVDVGSLVSPGQDLGRLVGTENYWVVAAVPQSMLRWLVFSGDGSVENGAEVKIFNSSAWGPEGYRTGVLQKMVGELEESTRLVKVLISVPDPLGITESREYLPELLIGSFVEVEIEGREIEDVVRLSRDYLRNQNTVWVMHDGKLKIRKVDVKLTDAGNAYIKSGLEDGDQVVTTNLATVVEDAPLRVEEETD
ncbi:RND family efflux transporter MFP subunit [Marinilabilia salmonicolor]|jgi:RND family efflux transporter MFP subunit|uniref:efflux RND transporter periplasmic adaptor subunit n=1 Tax=Marinilabilia salmonicolor TaxID=989 RepID=UPI000D081874|nr:efflux RND transporter periplasmic adaptor subunit [Marinilabilia salmonicolor]PRZ00625.1 RND family efflux transporter MFP subunit [Marinilabilia salmonicolor]